MESFRNACNKKCQYYAFQRNATTPKPLEDSEIASRWDACCYATFAGISLRLCYISLRSFRITFAAYLPTHIKFLTEFHRIFFRTTCISFPKTNLSALFFI